MRLKVIGEGRKVTGRVRIRRGCKVCFNGQTFYDGILAPFVGCIVRVDAPIGQVGDAWDYAIVHLPHATVKVPCLTRGGQYI